MSTATGRTVLDRLREETRPAHEALERALDPFTRIRTVADYRSLLARFYGFHLAWEPVIRPLVGDDDFLLPRLKLGLLAEDLRQLGLTSGVIAALPACEPVPAFGSRAEALGSLYVLEGSTLGGQIIARHVGKVLGLASTSGCAYHSAYGRAAGAMWRAFRAYMLAGAPSDAAAGAAVRGAARTFAALHHWLDPGQEAAARRGAAAAPSRQAPSPL